MELTEEKILKLNQLNTDHAKLVLRFHRYLTDKPVLMETLKEDVISEEEAIKRLQQKDGFINIAFLPNHTIPIEGIENAPKLRIMVDISSVSTGTIWNTKMRRKMKSTIHKINALEEKELTDERIYQILSSDDLYEVTENKDFTLDFIVEQVKQVFQKASHADRIEVFYILALKEATDEEIFLTNELFKFVSALRLGENKYSYIYDTICYDMDHMFSKYGFCDFQNNKCLSQRHKNLLKNRYPVPNRDGCCFDAYHKCKHLNRRWELSGKVPSL